MKITQHVIIGGIFVSLGFSAGLARAGTSGAILDVVLDEAGKQQPLKSWGVQELRQFKAVSSSEKNPTNGKTMTWKGALFSAAIDEAMKSLTPERRSQIDLVVLTGESGEKALIPRAFIVKYPMLLAYEGADTNGKITSVAPWSSRPKSQQEGLPLQTYFVKGVRTIELANYRQQYGDLFLKRRTDPAAMRGEKIVIQNCVVCNSSGQKPCPSVKDIVAEFRTRALASTGPAACRGATGLSDRDRRALANYFDAYRAENAGPATGPAPTATSAKR